MRYRVLILLLILGCSMDLAPDNGKTDFIYSALEIIDRIFFVTKLSPVQLQATGEGNIAPAKRGKRAQFLFLMIIVYYFGYQDCVIPRATAINIHK